MELNILTWVLKALLRILLIKKIEAWVIILDKAIKLNQTINIPNLHMYIQIDLHIKVIVLKEIDLLMTILQNKLC